MVDAIINEDFVILELENPCPQFQANVPSNVWTRVLKRGYLTGVKTRFDFFVCQNIDGTALAF